MTINRFKVNLVEQFADMTTLLRPPGTMQEIYQSLPESTPVQLINNQLVLWLTPKDIHHKIKGKLLFSINKFIAENNLGKIRIAPSDVYLNEENIYQPDIYFISQQNLSGFQEDGFHGAPDLVIEILSPGTEKHDKTYKLKVYEACGVREYWLVNPKIKKPLVILTPMAVLNLFVRKQINSPLNY